MFQIIYKSKLINSKIRYKSNSLKFIIKQYCKLQKKFITNPKGRTFHTYHIIQVLDINIFRFIGIHAHSRKEMPMIQT